MQMPSKVTGLVKRQSWDSNSGLPTLKCPRGWLPLRVHKVLVDKVKGNEAREMGRDPLL